MTDVTLLTDKQDWAYDRMSQAQGNVVAFLETKLNYDPCPAIKESDELLAPAWEVYEAFHALRKHVRAEWFMYGLIAGMLVGGILIWVTQ